MFSVFDLEMKRLKDVQKRGWESPCPEAAEEVHAWKMSLPGLKSCKADVQQGRLTASEHANIQLRVAARAFNLTTPPAEMADPGQPESHGETMSY